MDQVKRLNAPESAKTRIDASLLVKRAALFARWHDNLKLYEHLSNSAHNTLVDDFLPFPEETNRLFKRELELSAIIKRQETAEDRKHFRIMKNVIDNQFDKLHDSDLEVIRENFPDIVLGIIKDQLPNIDLILFMRYFEEESLQVLMLSIEQRDDYLPEEMMILLNYAFEDDDSTFERAWDLFQKLGVDRQARTDVILRFALEAGNIGCLRYFMPDQEFLDCFTRLDLHTYAVINHHSFVFLLQYFEQRGILDQLLLRRDHFGFLPIHAAAFLGNMDVMRAILKKYNCLNELSGDGMSVLECVFCSQSTLAQRLVVQYLLDLHDEEGQFSECRNEYGLNYFHLSLAFMDADALVLLNRYGEKRLLFEKSGAGVTPIEEAAGMFDPKFLQLLTEELNHKEIEEILRGELSQQDEEKASERDEYTFITPMQNLELNFHRKRNLLYANTTRIVIAMYFTIFSLAFILPPMLLRSDYIQTTHFMVSESIMFVVFSYNIVMLFMINFVWRPMDEQVKITDVPDFKKIAYCVQGDRILMHSAYFHCDICSKCQPVGSYHSNLIGLCVYKNQRWMYFSSISLALCAFIIELQLVGEENSQSIALAVLEAIFQIILVGMITILSVTLVSFVVFLFSDEEQVIASKEKRRGEVILDRSTN